MAIYYQHIKAMANQGCTSFIITLTAEKYYSLRVRRDRINIRKIKGKQLKQPKLQFQNPPPNPTEITMPSSDPPKQWKHQQRPATPPQVTRLRTQEAKYKTIKTRLHSRLSPSHILGPIEDRNISLKGRHNKPTNQCNQREIQDRITDQTTMSLHKSTFASSTMQVSS